MNSSRRFLMLACFAASPLFSQQETMLKGIVDQMVLPLTGGANPVKGLVVGIATKGQTMLFTCGENGRRSGEKPTGDDLFRIASGTKPLTGLLLAQLVAEGKIHYADPVAECAAGEISAFCYEGTPVTVMHLLTHYSGLPVTANDFSKFLAEYKLARKPGSRFEYSTVGYAVLGKILAEKSGYGDYEKALEAKVLHPLAMSSTVFFVDKGTEERYAGNLAGVPRQGGGVNSASGGLLSSANDLLKFLAANIEPEKHTGLAEALRTTQQIDTLKSFPGSSVARGWHVIGGFGFYWHSGVSSDSRALMTFNPGAKSGVVILTNTGLPPSDSRIEQAGFGILGALSAMK